jgi:D-tyrosyl-tRNA(Tyr) deacylase
VHVFSKLGFGGFLYCFLETVEALFSSCATNHIIPSCGENHRMHDDDALEAILDAVKWIIK